MNEKNKFVFDKTNYMFIIGGFVVTLIGFVLMTGGASEDRTVFNPEIFNTTRITIAPFLVIAGFAIVIYGIMKKRKLPK